MSLRYLIKLANSIPSKVQQPAFAQQIAAQHGVNPYYVQNDLRSALRDLTGFARGERKPITNPIYATVMPSDDAKVKPSKKVEPMPVLSAYEQGTGVTGAYDAFAKAHKLHPEEEKSNMSQPGKRVLSLRKNKDFTKLTASGTNGKGNPTPRS